jgi:hypothetical protein
MMSALIPIADMCGALAHVRFVPIADIRSYSRTTSAVASNAGETASPSASAVFKFMTNSYFVGVCTGGSAGFSPLCHQRTSTTAHSQC